ncbi:hypothetical protein ZWY2020_028861 [Hordeum vulgare]|nr:hypothetical protein ZWY2020_028861 [Hordeum vulgare]
MFSMFQYLAPENSIDKCSHHYTICLHLKYQWFEVLDSIRSGDDTNLTSHVEFFVINLKETWNRHYGSSNVQISHFPIEMHHIRNTILCPFYKMMLIVFERFFCCTHDCGYYMLEYLTKWERRKVPTISKASVIELRKILTLN